MTEYYTERHVTSPSGAVYEVVTTVQTENGWNENAELVNLSVVEAPDSWEMEEPRTTYDARPVTVGESEPPGWSNSDRSCWFTPAVSDRDTRTTVPVEWHRVGNPLAGNEPERRRETIRLRLPQRYPVEVALRASRGEFGETERKLVGGIVEYYKKLYLCSAESAYATWLYDAALVLSDDDHDTLVNTVEAERDDIPGVTCDVLRVDDLTDHGDRLAATLGLGDDASWQRPGSGWLLDDGYVRLDWAEEGANGRMVVDDDRDPKFRRRVLGRYGTACAICGTKVETPDGRPGVEAAHVHSRSDGGPDNPENGLPMCPNHHWAYDAGWLAISGSNEILVADAPDATGYEQFEQFRGQTVRIESDARPALRYVHRHQRLHGFKDTEADDGGVAASVVE